MLIYGTLSPCTRCIRMEFSTDVMLIYSLPPFLSHHECHWFDYVTPLQGIRFNMPPLYTSNLLSIPVSQYQYNYTNRNEYPVNPPNISPRCIGLLRISIPCTRHYNSIDKSILQQQLQLLLVCSIWVHKCVDINLTHFKINAIIIVNSKVLYNYTSPYISNLHF